MWLGHLISTWFWFNGIFIGTHRDFNVEYNNIYGFYDLSLFEILGNGGPARISHFEKVPEFLIERGYRIETMPTYRWDNRDGKLKGEKISGVRIWIYVN